jgi:hypothetical protein
MDASRDQPTEEVIQVLREAGVVLESEIQLALP